MVIDRPQDKEDDVRMVEGVATRVRRDTQARHTVGLALASFHPIIYPPFFLHICPSLSALLSALPVPEFSAYAHCNDARLSLT